MRFCLSHSVAIRPPKYRHIHNRIGLFLGCYMVFFGRLQKRHIVLDQTRHSDCYVGIERVRASEKRDADKEANESQESERARIGEDSPFYNQI